MRRSRSSIFGVAHDVVQAVDVRLYNVLDVFPGDRAGLVDRFPENAGPPAAQDERDVFIQFGTGNAMHADVAPRADFGQDVFVKSIDMFLLFTLIDIVSSC